MFKNERKFWLVIGGRTQAQTSELIFCGINVQWWMLNDMQNSSAQIITDVCCIPWRGQWNNNKIVGLCAVMFSVHGLALSFNKRHLFYSSSSTPPPCLELSSLVALEGLSLDRWRPPVQLPPTPPSPSHSTQLELCQNLSNGNLWSVSCPWKLLHFPVGVVDRP